jgi:hypothetical protein
MDEEWRKVLIQRLIGAIDDLAGARAGEAVAESLADGSGGMHKWDARRAREELEKTLGELLSSSPGVDPES